MIMINMKPFPKFQLLVFLLFLTSILQYCQANYVRYKFVVEEAPYTRLCSTKKILTVNGKFPGPPLYVHKGETIIVDVYNKASENITIHWHGVKQPRYPWSDGPEYITQCPIQPGAKFSQKLIFSSEEGTLWWHAHSTWARATVHGAIVVYPKKGTTYPFPKPHYEVPVILGDWWKEDIDTVYADFLQSGGDPSLSDAYTINGQPGDLLPCSSPETFKLLIDSGKTYLLRIINAALQEILFFALAKHNLTVVATDASYTKPYETDYIAIPPGKTLDVIFTANQKPGRYYMAAHAYSSTPSLAYDNTTATAIVEYNIPNHTFTSTPLMPHLPNFTDDNASFNFTGSLRSLNDKNHPIDVPLEISTRLFYTLSINTFECPNNSCAGPNGTRLASSINNISFVNPNISILQAYYTNRANGVFGTNFPSFPPLLFNFTADDLPLDLEITRRGTEVKVLDYNSTVELVFQGTNVSAGASAHPMHLHGYSFYVVGQGLGNFDKDKDPLNYNLVDPSLENTISVPVNGWTAIRFKANNPGVWFMHCHLERHLSWGMDTAFIVKNGKTPNSHILPPPPDMPPC